MKEMFLARLCAVFSIKSIVTLTLTGVFAYQSLTHQIDQQFMTVYTVVIAFYFGTQVQKTQEVVNNAKEIPEDENRQDEK